METSVLVGDSKYDIICAKNVQKSFPEFYSIGVTWCKTTHEEMQKLGADFIIDRPCELKEVLLNAAKL